MKVTVRTRRAAAPEATRRAEQPVSALPPSSVGEGDYKVGYGRPPKQHQFQKNVSGNPKGRPPGAKGFAPQLRKILRTSMPARINGQTVQLSRSQIICMALVDKAARGDMRAVKLLIDLDPMAQEELAKAAPSAVETALDDADEAMVAAYLRAVSKSVGSDEPEEGA